MKWPRANAPTDVQATKDNAHAGAAAQATPSNASSNDKNTHHTTTSYFATKVKKLWARTGIDRRTAMQMFKGSLAPVICICAYQSTPWAETYSTVGYLVGIMSVLSLVIAPRAKFIQTMLMNIFFICAACLVGLLAMFCCVKARVNAIGHDSPGTGGPGTSGLAAGGAETARARCRLRAGGCRRRGRARAP